MNYLAYRFIIIIQEVVLNGDSPSKKFKVEVLDLGATGCLPANLSDYWLLYLSKELNLLDNMSEAAENENADLSCSLAAVVAILHAQNGGGNMYSATVDELFDKIIDYRIEIGLEMVSRHSEIKCEPATLEDIFTNRDVKYRFR